MSGGVRGRFAEAASAVRAVLANRKLRRLELGRAAALVGSGYTVVFVVLAHGAGGSAGVGALIAATTWTAAGAAPFASVVADRFPRHRVIATADVLRVVVLVAGAVVAAATDAEIALVIALAGVATAIGMASSSARAALVPALARSPEELVAANAVAATAGNVAAVAGPALAGLALAVGGATEAFLLCAAAYAVSAAAARGIAADDDRAPAARRAGGGLRREALAGVQVLLTAPGMRLVVALAALRTLTGGALGVVLVVAAIETLGFGASGPGFVSAALAGGGLIGALVLLGLVGRRLGTSIAAGTVVWGGALSLVGVLPEPAIALALVAVAGLADGVGDGAAMTFAQRTIPNDVFARAFGALRTLFYALASIGSLLAPILLATVGDRAALVVAGAVAPTAALLLWRALTRLDADAPPALARLRAIPFFDALPPGTLERLAAGAEPVRVAAGEAVFREGDHGDRFYVVADGDVSVSRDGRDIATATAGDFFGEIALLRDVPRTATVTARGDAELYAIGRDDFLAAVTADSAAAEAAEAVAAARMRRAG